MDAHEAARNLIEAIDREIADAWVPPGITEAADTLERLLDLEEAGGVGPYPNIPLPGFTTWDDHPDFSDRAWRDDETRLGYWSWVRHQLDLRASATQSALK